MFFRGLINNGCTCYVNASLQSLFHCDVTKNFILETHQDKKEHQRQTESESQFKNTESTVITALQQLFYNLQYSIKYYLGTKRFCKALGMSDTDMLEQKDANELIKNVLDRLEQHCQQIKDEKIRFNKIFVGTFRGMITCQKCKNSSLTVENFTDLIISIQDDFWAGLANILWPQHVEGYFCTQCQSKQNAQKRITIENIPELLQITLQRFKYDQYGYLHKDDNMIRMPLFIDLFILNTIDIYKHCQFKKINFFKLLLQVILQPWNYVKFDENNIVIDSQLSKAVRQSFQQLLNIKKIYDYLQQYYSDIQLADPFSQVSCDVQQSFSTNNDSLFMMTINSSDTYNAEQYPVFSQESVPPHYYSLTSITCHSGSLNQGHYYNLCIKQMVNDPQKFVMFNCNDTYIQAIANPQEMLNKISGKDVNQELGNLSNTIKDKQNSRQNQSNTGYMYFYERLCNKQGNSVKDIKLVCKSPHLIKMIQQENQEIEKEIYTINVRLYSNYNEQTQSCDIFGTQSYVEFDFDLRGSTQLLIQEYFKNLKHVDIKTKKKLSSYSICIHQCEQNTNKRTQLLTDIIDDKTSLESCLFSQFNNLNYTKNFKKQLGKEQKKQITLFVEIIIDQQLKFEYQYVYVWLCKVEVEKNDELFCDNVIGYQKSLKIVNKITYKVDKQKLIEQFYDSQYYNKKLCSGDQQGKQYISIDNRQILCEIMLLKIAICNIDQSASIDRMLVYKKDPMQQQIQLCNTINQPQSDMTALVTLHNQDEIFYESLDVKLGNQILYLQPKLNDYQKLKSKILQIIENELLVMLRIYNSQFTVIKQQLISDVWNQSVLIQKCVEYVEKNALIDEKMQENKYNLPNQIKFYILLKSKEGFKTLEFPKDDLNIKELLQYIFVQNKLPIQPQNLNIIYFSSEHEYQEFNTSRKMIQNVKRPNQQEKPTSTGIAIKITNQRTKVQKEYQFDQKLPITDMFSQLSNIFNSQKEIMKTSPRGRIKPDLVLIDNLLEYNGRLTVQQFLEIYFQLKYKVYSFIVQKKMTVKQATLKIILQKPQKELELQINKNKIDKQCVIQSGNNWGKLIQSQYKNINFTKYLFFFYSSENNYIFFDYNEIRDPMNSEVKLNCMGNYTLLIDEKSNFVMKYEDYWKDQYINNHYYYYATIYYSKSYGRVRIFKGQSANDLIKFIENVFNQKVNVFILTNKKYQLKDNQDLISKIDYGLFICE